MKIAMYLQDDSHHSRGKFYRVLSEVKKSDVGLLVFPEICWTPFKGSFYGFDDITAENRMLKAIDETHKISNLAGCPVIVCGMDNSGIIFSVYANPLAGKDETSGKIYLKHTMADNSPLSFADYDERLRELFEPVYLSGKKIGMTICYDCNHAAFSRAYGKNGVDILINSTGGNVDYPKWYRYNKVRAIENRCFNFVTMGYTKDYKSKPNSYTYGFTPKGKLMEGKPLFPIRDGDEWGKIGNVFVYDTDSAGNEYEPDINLSQSETLNQGGGPFWKIDPSGTQALLGKCKKIDCNLYIKKAVKNLDVVIAVIENDDIVKPEIVLEKLYHPALEKSSRKSKRKYLIVNSWGQLEQKYYENILSDILRVRAMENYCAVLLVSDKFSKCYQTTDNRKSQLVAPEGEAYNLDLGRMGGPEAIWKNKHGMRGAWRSGYERLIDSLL